MKISNDMMEIKVGVIGGLMYLDNLLNDIRNGTWRDPEKVKAFIQSKMSSLKEEYMEIKAQVEKVIEIFKEGKGGNITDVFKIIEEKFGTYEAGFSSRMEAFKNALTDLMGNKTGALLVFKNKIKEAKETCKSVFDMIKEALEKIKPDIVEFMKKGSAIF